MAGACGSFSHVVGSVVRDQRVDDLARALSRVVVGDANVVGDRDPPIGFARVAVGEVEGGDREREGRVFDEGGSPQELDPRGDVGVVSPSADGGRERPPDQLTGALPVAGVDGMSDCAVVSSPGLPPGAGPQMEGGEQLRFVDAQVVDERFAEEGMQSVPVAVSVDRQDHGIVRERGPRASLLQNRRRGRLRTVVRSTGRVPTSSAGRSAAPAHR